MRIELIWTKLMHFDMLDMSSSHFFDIFFSVLVLLIFIRKTEAGHDQQCKMSRCNKHGPAIRFPFWLKNVQPQYCGYGLSFELSCNQKNQTVLHLPSSVKVIVKKINYKSQWIEIYDPNTCLPAQVHRLNLSVSPFQFLPKDDPFFDFSLFNCSLPIAVDRYHYYSLIPCLSVGSNKIYAVYGYAHHPNELLSCVKIYNISSIPDIYESKYLNKLQLSWLEPNCTKCEAQRKMCGLLMKTNYTSSSAAVEVQCVLNLPKTAKGTTKKVLVTGLVLGIFLVLLGILALSRVYISRETYKEDQLKIAHFLEDYKALKSTRFFFSDIKKITNNFKEKLGEGAYGTVFRGKFSNEIVVAVKLLRDSKGSGEEFINEVGTMSRIHHVNVVRMVGFCADGIRRALVYEFLPNGSLEKFIFLENQKNNSLNWHTQHNIALGIAKGIEYLHQGCDHRILHFDIKPHNILLDQNFNPKISDFGLAKLCSKEQSIVSMSAARGTVGYMAPELFSRNFGNVSYKSDIYSFGMLLLEMVSGRKNIDDTTVPNTSLTYFPEWVYHRLSNGEEFWMKNIEKEDEHSEIAKKLTIVGLWCIQWHPIDRPPMKTVVQMLEGKRDTLTVPPNPFSATPRMGHSTRPVRALNTELEVISEAE